jgi:hypothetical protein
MRKSKLGRPPKKESEKMMKRITVPLTNQDYQDLLRYEKISGQREHAKTVRGLFLKALRKQLALAKKEP